MNVTVYFKDSRLAQGDIERALNPNGRAQRVGSGTHLPTNTRDVEYSYASLRSAEKAMERVHAFARSKRARVKVELS